MQPPIRSLVLPSHRGAPHYLRTGLEGVSSETPTPNKPFLGLGVRLFRRLKGQHTWRIFPKGAPLRKQHQGAGAPVWAGREPVARARPGPKTMTLTLLNSGLGWILGRVPPSTSEVRLSKAKLQIKGRINKLVPSPSCVWARSVCLRA